MGRATAVFFISVLLGTAAAAQSPAPPAASPRPATEARIADVGWMAGRWENRTADALSEEVWTSPEGDMMLGMWRYVGGGTARVLEILTLTEEKGAVVLRLRHFDGRLTAREEKDAPVALTLVRKGPQEAVFEGIESDKVGLVRLTYRLQGEALTSTLEKGGKSQDFNFKRAAR